jgi:hypothetical protein
MTREDYIMRYFIICAFHEMLELLVTQIPWIHLNIYP